MTSGLLLDVNLLIALLWPAHVDHARAQRWFAANSRFGWATCPFTQASFVRIVSNPRFSPEAVPPTEAADVLRANLSRSDHYFWPDDISLAEAIEPFRKRIAGHQQITDAYLLGLALHRRGKLVTMDQGLAALIQPGSLRDELVLVV